MAIINKEVKDIIEKGDLNNFSEDILKWY